MVQSTFLTVVFCVLYYEKSEEIVFLLVHHQFESRNTNQIARISVQTKEAFVQELVLKFE